MKATKLLVAGVAIMSAGLGLSGSVDADTARSTAEVLVEPGDLLLETVPDLKFTDVGVQEISEGTVVSELESGTLTVADPLSEGDDSLTTTVGDFRGAVGGWSLSAELAPFTRVTGGDTILATMSLTPTSATFDGTIQPTTVIGSTSTLLATAAAGEGVGRNAFEFAPGQDNFLTISQQNVREGVYQAAMTWTLSATPE